MSVAEIPRRDPPGKHGAVVTLSILYYSGILLGSEELIGIESSVPARKVGGAAAHLDQLHNDFVLTSLAQPECCRVAIGLNIFAKLFEATISEAGSPGRFRINFVQIIEDRARRRIEAVHIHAVQRGAWTLVWHRVVVVWHPVHEVQQ